MVLPTSRIDSIDRKNSRTRYGNPKTRGNGTIPEDRFTRSDALWPILTYSKKKENPAIKRELAEVESASVSPAGKLDLAIEINSRSYQINNMLKNPFLEEFILWREEFSYPVKWLRSFPASRGMLEISSSVSWRLGTNAWISFCR